MPADATAYLYAPRPGFRAGAQRRAPQFLFMSKAAPKDTVELQIVDSHGTVVRTMTQAGRRGANLITWDLRYDGPDQPELRTTPPDNPHIWDEARFKDKDTRPVDHWGIQGTQRQGPLAAPGKYTARLTVDGQTFTRPFEVVDRSRPHHGAGRPRGVAADADQDPRRPQHAR